MNENPWPIANRTGSKAGRRPNGLTVLEVCAGAGGQALGFEMAGFEHTALVELDRHACSTLSLNRPSWKVIQGDLQQFDPEPFLGVDVVAGGLPCPPFSVAGKQLGSQDERNLFPAMIRIVQRLRPRAVVIENVRGLLEAVFEDYRLRIADQLAALGYSSGWKLLNASDFGVPQLRPRVVCVALRREFAGSFAWPRPLSSRPPTVGERLSDLMFANGWKGASAWAKRANEIAPTVVGGSHKHGGPDLGPTRARKAWASLGVDGLGIADNSPARDFVGMPRLTVRMVARLQGFPDEWQFVGGKTQSYRQVGNAFPPPFAAAIAGRVRECLLGAQTSAVGA